MNGVISWASLPDSPGQVCTLPAFQVAAFLLRALGAEMAPKRFVVNRYVLAYLAGTCVHVMLAHRTVSATPTNKRCAKENARASRLSFACLTSTRQTLQSCCLEPVAFQALQRSSFHVPSLWLPEIGSQKRDEKPSDPPARHRFFLSAHWILGPAMAPIPPYVAKVTSTCRGEELHTTHGHELLTVSSRTKKAGTRAMAGEPMTFESQTKTHAIRIARLIRQAFALSS